MRNSIITLILFLPIFLFSQTKTSETIRILKMVKSDDVGSFVKFINEGNDINDCYEMRGSSYNFLILSIKYDSQKIFRKCLALKADEEGTCNEKTPLMYAVKYNRKEFMEILISRGVDKKVMNEEGISAYDYAIEYRRKGFISLLE